MFRPLALLAVLSIAAAGCQKDNALLQPSTTQTADTQIHYSFGNTAGSCSPQNDADWDDFLSYMLALAREGYVVTIHNDNVVSISAKESITYVATEESDAIRWTKTKIKEGYHVTITYNKTSGVYNCIAVK